MRIGRIPEQQRLPAAGSLAEQRAARVQHEAGAIEHQLIVAAHLVDVDERTTGPRGGSLPQLPAQGELAAAIGGGGEVEQQIHPQLRQLTDRIDTRHAQLLQVLLDPQVLADAQPQPPGAAALPLAPLQPRRPLAGQEIAALIEDVVAGQQPLAGHHLPAATTAIATTAAHQRHGIPKTWGATAGHRIGHTHQRRQAGRQTIGQGLQLNSLARHQGRAQQQIAGWVAPQRQLRRQQQLGPVLGRQPAGREDPRGIALQIADQGIELGEGEAHPGVSRP